MRKDIFDDEIIPLTIGLRKIKGRNNPLMNYYGTLDLKVEGDLFQIHVTRYERGDIYGDRSTKIVDEEGNELQTASRTEDFRHIIPSGGYKKYYVDENDNVIDKDDVIKTDMEGNPLKVQPPMFEDIQYLQEFTFEEIHLSNVISTHLIMPESDRKSLNPNKEVKKAIRGITKEEKEIFEMAIGKNEREREERKGKPIPITEIKSIDRIGTRHVKGLKEIGCDTIEDLENMTIAEISKANGIGKTTAEKLKSNIKGIKEREEKKRKPLNLEGKRVFIEDRGKKKDKTFFIVEKKEKKEKDETGKEEDEKDEDELHSFGLVEGVIDRVLRIGETEIAFFKKGVRVDNSIEKLHQVIVELMEARECYFGFPFAWYGGNTEEEYLVLIPRDGRIVALRIAPFELEFSEQENLEHLEKIEEIEIDDESVSMEDW